MKLHTYILLFTMALAAACHKEETLTPSESLAYSLPQGSHDYDTTIMSYYNKYNTYLLYKFTDKDAYWTPTGWKNAYYDSTYGYWHEGFDAAPAEEQYVDKQLQIIQRLWFRYYSDQFLKDYLPVKILLSSAVDSVYVGYDFSTNPFTYLRLQKPVYAWYNYDNISVSLGNSTIIQMTPQDSGVFTWKTSVVFMQEIIARKPITPTDEFTKLTSYTVPFTSQEAAYANGSVTDYYNASSQNDWNYLMLAMVSTSETTLNEAEEPGWSATTTGILNPLKDSSGKIRQRYDIVRNYFINKYNVDLQAIGNAAIPQ